MPQPLHRPELASGAVLAIGHGQAEWYERLPARPAVVGACLPSGLTATDLAAACLRAREAAGSQARNCVLMLGKGLVAQRLVALPELPRADLANVLARKAAALLGAQDQDVLYNARLMPARAQAGEPAGNEQLWLVCAARASELKALRLHLRGHKLNVSRVVAAELAALDLAHACLESPEQPAIAVHFEPATIAVALLAGDQLVYHDQIEGDFLAQPALAASLLQTLKTTVGYWRKLSRGENVDQVVVIGLPSERGQLLGHAIEASLPGARVRVLPAPEEALDSGRSWALSAGLHEGPFGLSLAGALPLRRSWTAGVAAASLVCALAIGLVQRGRAVRDLNELRGEVERLAVQSIDLEDLQLQSSRAQALEERVQAELLRLVRIGTAGVPVERVLTELLEACSSRAALMTVEIGPARNERRPVALRAWTDPDPALSALAVGAIQRELAQGGSYGPLEAGLPQQVESLGGKTGGLLEFTLTGELEGG